MDHNWNIIGHEWAVQYLHRSLANERATHAYVIAGLPNVGKTLLATRLAQALNCEQPNAPCGDCRACRRIEKGSFPDVRSTGLQAQAAAQKPSESVKQRLGIDAIREWQADIALRPYEGRRRVFILHNAETLTDQAANAMLKTLEEPPPYATLILLANGTGDLLPTIASRCQALKLRPVPRHLIENALIERWNIAPADAHTVAAWSGGRMGWAVTVAQSPELLAARSEHLDALLDIGHQSLIDRFKWAEKIGKGDKETVHATLELWQLWWRDVLLTAAGTPAGIINVDRADELQALAKIPLPKIHAVLRSLGEATQQIKENVSPQLALEGVLLQLPT